MLVIGFFFYRKQQLGCIYLFLGLAGWEQKTDKGTGTCKPVMAWSLAAWVVTVNRCTRIHRDWSDPPRT